jgi:hypothetical protein
MRTSSKKEDTQKRQRLKADTNEELQSAAEAQPWWLQGQQTMGNKALGAWLQRMQTGAAEQNSPNRAWSKGGMNPQIAARLQRTIGNRAMGTLIQRQKKGSITIGSSADVEEPAGDEGSYGLGLSKALQKNQNLGELLKERAQKHHIGGSGKQYPGFAQTGEGPGIGNGHQSPFRNRKGLYIGNGAYKHSPPWRKLKNAESDADAMESAMSKQGFETIGGVQKGLNEHQIYTAFSKGINEVNSGDTLLLFFAGHGLPPGVIGVDSNRKPPSSKDKNNFEDFTDTVSYNALMPLLDRAEGKGVHTVFISDACHSGGATNLLRQKAVERFAHSPNPDIQLIHSSIQKLEALKSKWDKIQSQTQTQAATAYLFSALPFASDVQQATAQKPAENQGGGTTRGFSKSKDKPPEFVPTPEQSEQWAQNQSRVAAFDSILESELNPILAVIQPYLSEKPPKFSEGDYKDFKQKIDRIINQLLAKAESIKAQEEEPLLPKVPGGASSPAN